MAIYNLTGVDIDSVYDVAGTDLLDAYDIEGNSVFGGSAKMYSKYMGHISPMDGYYNSHAYDAVFIKDGYLYVFYTQAPHHFTAKTDSTTSLMLCKYNLSTKSVVSNTRILNPARCFWHGIEVNGTYYLFSESGTKYRLATTDFINFTETTWTAPSTFSNMNYIIEGANNRLICTTGQTEKRMRIFYSDDLGLTWTLASGYADAVTTHGGFVHLGNGRIVLYCQDSYTGSMSSQASSHDTKRVVMISDDNGETWTGSLCQDPDLIDCGITYSSGSFCKIGDDWYFGTSRRIVEAQTGGTFTLGDIRLFKGTEQDVINGSMSLYKTVDNFDTGATRIAVAANVIQSDSGNMCMRTDGNGLYLVYHRSILHQDSSAYCESNSMTCLAIVDSVRGSDVADDFYNPNWEAERDAFVSAKDTSYDLYAYGLTNNFSNSFWTSNDYPKIETTDVLTKSAGVTIPFVNSFELIAVFYFGNWYINGDWADQYMGANVNGDVHVIGGYSYYLFNRPFDSGSNGACSLGTYGERYQYFKLKLDNGVVSVTLNGRTISDVKCPALMMKRDITNGNIRISYGDMDTYLASYTSSEKLKGIKALAINTDGDISGLVS